MFGLLYMLFGVGVRGADKLSQTYEDAKAMNEAKSKNKLTYSWRNQTRLTANGRQVGKKLLPNGHEVLVDLYNGKIYHDYTQEKNEKKTNEALANGETVLYYDVHDPQYKHFKKSDWYRKLDMRPLYVDIKTKSPLNMIAINHIKFYINLDTGYVIRPADKENVDGVDVEKLIDKFNSNQDLLRKSEKYNYDDFFSWKWIRNYFYSHCNCIIIDENGKVNRVYNDF